MSGKKFEEWKQDMWWVLVEKTTGDALLRVKGVEQGQGMVWEAN